MPNVVKACWELNELRLSLISIKSRGLPLEKGYLIDEVASETLGKQVILNEFGSDKSEQLERALICCSADRKLTRLVNRLRNNTAEFPIDEIRANGTILECQWMVDQLKELLKMEINSIETICDTEESRYGEEIKEAHELLMYYKGKEIVLINEQQIFQNVKEIDIVFELSFSLDTAMNFVIYERWRENGITTVKELSKATFYHPIFYTGDKMSIHVKKVEGKWQFHLTHLETGEKMSF